MHTFPEHPHVLRLLTVAVWLLSEWTLTCVFVVLWSHVSSMCNSINERHASRPTLRQWTRVLSVSSFWNPGFTQFVVMLLRRWSSHQVQTRADRRFSAEFHRWPSTSFISVSSSLVPSNRLRCFPSLVAIEQSSHVVFVLLEFRVTCRIHSCI